MAVDVSACDTKEADRILIGSCNGDFYRHFPNFLKIGRLLRRIYMKTNTYFCTNLDCNLLNNYYSENYL